jgi:glucose/arabinose dehydrogenase
MKFYTPSTNTVGTVSGLPTVAYGGQGGLGDVAFDPNYTTNKRIYLSWAEEGTGGTRGAAVGRGTLNCGSTTACSISGLTVIWRQNPKVTGTNHFSHKLAFSPNGEYLFVTSGERDKQTPAQDLDVNLGKIVRLNLDGTPADDNPFASRGGVSPEIWSYGHRNILGLEFDSAGRLWGLEHGPEGGDELNLIKRGLNYGWPLASNGNNYDGSNIPDHTPSDGFAAPAISWNPVIAPGDFIFYRGSLFPWTGQVIIAGLKVESLVRVTISGENGTEVRRYKMNDRIRDIEEAPDGAIWVIEDGSGGRLLRLTPN